MSKDRIKTASGRKGRPTKIQERAITEKIIAAALSLFLRDGYEATSMKGVIESSRVSPGTLYARFPDKQALFSAAITRQVEIWKDSRPVVSIAGNSLYQVLEGSAIRLMKFFETPDVKAFSKLLSVESERFPEIARLYRDNALKIGISLLEANILLTPEGKKLGPHRSHDIATTLFECITGWSHSRIFREPEENEAPYRKSASRIAGILSGSSELHT